MLVKELIGRLIDNPEATVGFFFAEQLPQSPETVHLVISTNKNTSEGEMIMRSVLRMRGVGQKSKVVLT
jgi:hypothetical protein